MSDITIYLPKKRSLKKNLPLFLCRVSAGFPPPAEEYMRNRLNLHDYAVDDDLTTFFAEAEGDSMDKLGIFHGTKLVVDKAIQPKDGDIIIAHLNGGCLIKKLRIKHDRVFLCPMSHNPIHQIIEVKELDQFYIQGVVIGIHTTFISKEEIRRRKL